MTNDFRSCNVIYICLCRKNENNWSLLVTRNTNTPCRNSFDAMLQVLVIFSVLSNLFVTLFTYGYLVELINSYSLNLAPTVT